MSSKELDEHFIRFATSLKGEIGVLDLQRRIQEAAESGEPLNATKLDSEESLARQKEQVELLWDLETQFRAALASCPEGMAIYERFISFIREERHNILDARPYFRERQTVFTGSKDKPEQPSISDALEARDAEALTKFRINYRFVHFAMQTPEWPLSDEVTQIARGIEKVRAELVVLNMPLAITRARIFFSHNQRTHLDLMDLVQIAAVGLMSGIDKFEPPYSRMFRGVAIGRMVGDLIEQTSATLLHLFPKDKRILYNVNKVTGRQVDGIDHEEVAQKVSELLKPKKKDGEEEPQTEEAKKVTAADVADILSAISFVSMSATANEDENAVRVEDAIAAPAECQPDVQVEKRETMRSLAAAIQMLSPFERKFLKLKGVQF